MSSWKQPCVMKQMVADVVKKMCQESKKHKQENTQYWVRGRKESV